MWSIEIKPSFSEWESACCVSIMRYTVLPVASKHFPIIPIISPFRCCNLSIYPYSITFIHCHIDIYVCLPIIVLNIDGILTLNINQSLVYIVVLLSYNQCTKQWSFSFVWGVVALSDITSLTLLFNWTVINLSGFKAEFYLK